MHTYINNINFLIIQQFFTSILITFDSFLHLFNYSYLYLLTVSYIFFTTFIQLLHLLTTSYNFLNFLTVYSSILSQQKKKPLRSEILTSYLDCGLIKGNKSLDFSTQAKEKVPKQQKPIQQQQLLNSSRLRTVWGDPDIHDLTPMI